MPWHRCTISTNEVRRGGYGPVVRTPSSIYGSAYLSPVVALTMFDEKLMVYIQVPVYEGYISGFNFIDLFTDPSYVCV
jgi:hypothetical protein